MADMTIESANLADLGRRASQLASAVQSLVTFFEEGAGRLRRRDQMGRLIALRTAILQEVEQVRQREKAANFGHSQASVLPSLIRLGVGLVTATSENPTMRRVSRALLTGPRDKEPSFGTVVICVGPRGLPEDVAVACVSRLARDTRRDELAVMEALRKQGYGLLFDSVFATLIDKVMEKIIDIHGQARGTL